MEKTNNKESKDKKYNFLKENSSKYLSTQSTKTKFNINDFFRDNQDEDSIEYKNLPTSTSSHFSKENIELDLIEPGNNDNCMENIYDENQEEFIKEALYSISNTFFKEYENFITHTPVFLVKND